MRTIALVMLLSLVGCGGKDSGIEEAKRQAELEDKAKGAASPPAKKMNTPVPGSARVPCTTLIQLPAFQTALAEKEPLTIKESVEADAAATCSLVRGGKRPNEAEQAALIKSQGHLGVLPGDIVCTINAFCWSMEDAEHVKKRCAETKGKDDDTMGNYSCVTVTPTGEADVQSFRFFDEDTKCILAVRGGPSMVDNDYIRACAKAARDSIGLPQIAVDGAAPAAPAAGSAKP